ncbi:MAG: 16S rRNA (cytidine(1402)-2'-O)-methyltransferase [Peptococcaceae bacterium]|nr:16S rRNA (cytidine(1402)-2'-O)-methyltransferase [Peptococcaceae bacterium]
MPEKGTLYICATPIGNLGDITIRVLETLKQVDFIAAEDTRHSKKLLDHYGIKTPMLSYHQHNEKQRAPEIITRLDQGENCALISDAGMPGISDPGQILIRMCQEQDIKIDVLPGPNAAITALVLSGMPTDSFLFMGFLPAVKGERRKKLENIKPYFTTFLFYEAPHKITKTLNDILEILGDRQAAVVRELTKIHQTVHKGLVSELLVQFQAEPPKGECCLILAPAKENISKGEPSDWLEEMQRLESQGIARKEAMKKAAQKYGIYKRELYKASIAEKEKGREVT